MVTTIAGHEVASLIKDNATLYTCGFGLAGFPEEVAIRLKESFLTTGHPRNLTLYFGASIGNTKDRGLHHFAQEGMFKRRSAMTALQICTPLNSPVISG